MFVKFREGIQINLKYIVSCRGLVQIKGVCFNPLISLIKPTVEMYARPGIICWKIWPSDYNACKLLAII